MKRVERNLFGFISISLVCLSTSGCFGSGESAAPASSGPSCPTPVTGTVWTPNIAGAGAGNHDATVVVTKTVTTVNGPITGHSQAAGAARELVVNIDMTQDLGKFGSLSLVGEVTSFPAGLSGGAYAALVSLHDGTNELINLSRTGAGGDCAASGYFSCGGSLYSCASSDPLGNPTPNPNCVVSWPSAYLNFAKWTEHMFSGSNSVYSFPTCNWAGGTAAVGVTEPACAFNSTFFTGAPARLRSGVNYTARYVLLASNYASLPGGYNGTLKVTVVKKQETNAAVGGAIDVNIAIVGTKNVNASRTAKGQQNLNTIFKHVHDYFNQANVGVKLGSVNVYEWPCEQGGDAYAQINSWEIGDMFRAGASLFPASGEGKALNIFLIRQFADSAGFLGIAGAIGGPMVNGTDTSGLVFATFDSLDQYNPLCMSGSATCPLNTQEVDFFDMHAGIAHEMGHYLGLNHPNERYATPNSYSDAVLDTPICTAQDTSTNPAVSDSTGRPIITTNSCLNLDTNQYLGGGVGSRCSNACLAGGGYNSGTGVYCSSVINCQFNHIMWWRGKNFTTSTGTGDGTIFSPNSGVIINYNPFIQ